MKLGWMKVKWVICIFGLYEEMNINVDRILYFVFNNIEGV